MRRHHVPLSLPVLVAAALCALASSVAAQAPRNHFRLSRDCAVCHSAARESHAMRSALGEDVSPHRLWRATMMANSFRDPYFRAQIEKESVGYEAAQELCLRCHTPMAHHQRTMYDAPPPRLADVQDEEYAHDGVSCTVCHQISAEGLGEERTFSGQPVIGRKRRIFGPFADPATGPMENMLLYTPTQGMHIRESGLCATCHTLFTDHTGGQFPEQTPYLEWRNSEFSTEVEGGGGDAARSCQECHMPPSAATRIARNPGGRDFVIPVRDGYRAHAFVGGNAFMLDLLRIHRDELAVQAPSEDLARMAAATRRQLYEATADVTIHDLALQDGALTFDVQVQNKTGHKFPTGYPARRAWLHVQVRRGRNVMFESGAFDTDGRLLGVGPELGLPHVTLVERPEDVPIYEMVAHDPDGQPTTYLTKMAGKLKDTRLLPRGWRRDGPHPEETAPVGTSRDFDFVAGGDTVAYRIALPQRGRGALQVVAWLHYQTIPPEWVDALRDVDGDAARRFVRIYDGANKLPETVGVAVATLQPGAEGAGGGGTDDDGGDDDDDGGR
ncbi:MAG: hypothetical protein AB7O97_15965 [Planctomycetota bacterium]